MRTSTIVCVLLCAAVAQAKIASLLPLVNALQAQSGSSTPLKSQYWLRGLENLALTACSECPAGKIVKAECTIADDTVCQDAFFTVGRDAAEIKKRSYPDGATNHNFVDTSAIFDKNCKVGKWNYYAERTNEHILQVWRLVSGTTYKLVGETVVTPSAVGVQEVILTDAQRFEVQAGDVIGWRHQSNGVISYSEGGPAVRWVNANRPNIGTSYNFNGSGARTYSVSAACTPV